jgi:hypothetical protein
MSAAKSAKVDDQNKLLRIRDVLIRINDNGVPHLVACRLDYCELCTGDRFQPTPYDWSLIEEMFHFWTKYKKIFPPRMVGPKNHRKNGRNRVLLQSAGLGQRFLLGDIKTVLLVNAASRAISEFRCQRCGNKSWRFNTKTPFCSQRCMDAYQERRKDKKRSKAPEPVVEPQQELKQTTPAQEPETNIIQFIPRPKPEPDTTEGDVQ